MCVFAHAVKEPTIGDSNSTVGPVKYLVQHSMCWRSVGSWQVGMQVGI